MCSDRTRIRGRFRIPALVALVFAASAWRARAQSYGLGDQVLTLGAAAFESADSDHPSGISQSDGYLFGSASHVAALTIPDGAEVFQVCLYGYVPEAGSGVDAAIYVDKLVPGGQSPYLRVIPASVVIDTSAIGYDSVCTAPFSYVFHDFEDVDSDGSPDPVAHDVQSNVFANAGLGGVRIFWRRQVSPAPDAPSFDDVPANDPYFEYVEALVASGITSGCSSSPPRFCPDAPLTRRQMAVFLSKALGLYWPN